jgi:phage tail protein X
MNGNDNAFPSSPERYEPEFGLTKRELIAAMAMQGLAANSGLADANVVLIAGWAVQHADALIERLNADPMAEGVNLLPMHSPELDEGLTDGK